MEGRSPGWQGSKARRWGTTERACRIRAPPGSALRVAGAAFAGGELFPGNPPTPPPLRTFSENSESQRRSDGSNLRLAGGEAPTLPGIKVRTRGRVEGPRGIHLGPCQQPLVARYDARRLRLGVSGALARVSRARFPGPAKAQPEDHEGPWTSEQSVLGGLEDRATACMFSDSCTWVRDSGDLV